MKLTPGVEGGLNQLVDARLADVADVLPDGAIFCEGGGIVAGEGHGSETDLRDEEAGIAEVLYCMGCPLCGAAAPAQLDSDG